MCCYFDVQISTDSAHDCQRLFTSASFPANSIEGSAPQLSTSDLVEGSAWLETATGAGHIGLAGTSGGTRTSGRKTRTGETLGTPTKKQGNRRNLFRSLEKQVAPTPRNIVSVRGKG